MAGRRKTKGPTGAGRDRHEVAGGMGAAAAAELLVDPVTELPTVPLVLGRMRELLETNRWLGVLTVNVVQAPSTSLSLSANRFDAFLRELTAFLGELKRQRLRQADAFGDVLINGNTFILLLSASRSARVPGTLDLLRIRDRLTEPLDNFVRHRVPGPFREQVICSLGCAIVEQDPNQRSDRQIYQVLDDAMRSSASTTHLLRPDPLRNLRQVIMERAITPVYQPVVDLGAGRVIGYEALSRVPEHLFPNIEHLFKVAQESNAVWQLERLCREKALIGVNGLPDGLSLFLNVEPDSVADPQFRSDETLDLIGRAGLTPGRVVLEMTEHSAVRDFRAFSDTLEHFRREGFRLAIDDVGSAYSGLQSVAELRPDFIKIDMSLIRDLHRHGIKRDLIQTIARFSAKAGISLIAEGVESAEELRELQKIGVLLAQGYLFARPEPPFPVARLDDLVVDRT